jgi:hypothetical protein
MKSEMSKSQKESYKNNPRRAQKQSEAAKKRWEDPEYRERVSNSISKAFENASPQTLEDLRNRAAITRSFITEESHIKRGKAISKANKGKPKPPRTPEHKAKLSAAKTGQKHKPESMLKSAITRGSKLFQVFNKSGELLGQWINKAECARDLNLNPSNLAGCLEGRRKSHKGLFFKYKL